MDSLKAFGRAFGKPSSLFIANWPLVLRRPVELAGRKRTFPNAICSNQCGGTNRCESLARMSIEILL